MKYLLTSFFALLCIVSNAQIEGDSDTSTAVFTKVDIESRFPGGSSGWREYLVNNLKADVPIRNGAKPGTYTVIVQFIVDREGNVSEIKPLTKHGHGMEDEVIRIIQKSPQWVPAEQNGRKVKAYKKQPVTFVVSSR